MISAADLLADIADSLATVLPEQRWFAGKGEYGKHFEALRAEGFACGKAKTLIFAAGLCCTGQQTVAVRRSRLTATGGECTLDARGQASGSAL